MKIVLFEMKIRVSRDVPGSLRVGINRVGFSGTCPNKIVFILEKNSQKTLDK